MRRLLDHGVPAERLSIAIAPDRRGDDHAFLLLRVNGGYLVLDSLTNRLVGPDGTGYRMLAMQTADDRARWKITEDVVTAHLGRSAAPVAKAADDRRLALAGEDGRRPLGADYVSRKEVPLEIGSVISAGPWWSSTGATHDVWQDRGVNT